jgi:hypothetical protein
VRFDLAVHATKLEQIIEQLDQPLRLPPTP